MRLAQARRHLVEELLEVSPRVEVDSTADVHGVPMRLWIDVGRHWEQVSAHTHRLERLLRSHAPYTLGIGPTASVAYAAALAAVSQRPRSISPEEAQDFLDSSPLRVLEFDTASLSTLADLGLRRVGDLHAFEPTALVSRLGPGAREALDRARGDDARGPRTPRSCEELELRVDLDDEIQETQALLFLLSPALERLATRLRARDRGVTRLTLWLEGERETCSHTLDLQLASPSAEAGVLLELLRTRLDALRLRAPVHAFTLSCPAIAPLTPDPRSLFEGATERDPGAREVVLGRLRERHGESAVHRASRQEDPRLLARAHWVHEGECVPGEAFPWRRLEPPVALHDGAAVISGVRRKLLRVGRCERVAGPFWEAGHARAELFAWAELEGPLVALLRGRVNDACDDHWEVVAWLD